MRTTARKAKLYMDTVVEIQAVDAEASSGQLDERMAQAFEAFRQVEAACSRFAPDSELSSLCRTVGKPVPASPLLYEPLRFAMEMAEATDGRFDPTVGKKLEEMGFNRHYLTGQATQSAIGREAESAAYQNVVLDDRTRTVLLKKPLLLDLGAVAKGFAIDLAAHALRGLAGFLINAGGDLYAAGTDVDGRPWSVGIQHPHEQDGLIYRLSLTDEAICTSGSYERASARVPGNHHIIHPVTARSPHRWVSCSVIAPYAMMADALSTAAFVLDEQEGAALLEEAGARALFVASDLRLVSVGGMERS